MFLKVCSLEHSFRWLGIFKKRGLVAKQCWKGKVK